MGWICTQPTFLVVSEFFQVSFQHNFILTPLWWYVLLSAIFLQSSCFPLHLLIYIIRVTRIYICLWIFTFPAGNVYAPCIEQSSSSSLPLSLQRTGQRKGSRVSAVYHQYYHSGLTSKFFNQYLFSDGCQKPYLRLIHLRRLKIGLKIGWVSGDPLHGHIALGDMGEEAKRQQFSSMEQKEKEGMRRGGFPSYLFVPPSKIPPHTHHLKVS